MIKNAGIIAQKVSELARLLPRGGAGIIVTRVS